MALPRGEAERGGEKYIQSRLSYKDYNTAGLLYWLYANWAQVDFVFKVNDDVYVIKSIRIKSIRND